MGSDIERWLCSKLLAALLSSLSAVAMLMRLSTVEAG